MHSHCRPPLPDGEGTEEQHAELDVEADGLLAQLAESQAEVQRMLEHQKAQSAELGNMKDQMAAEVRTKLDAPRMLGVTNA